MSYHAKLIKGGKIVIPAQLRREFGFEEGDSLVFVKDGDQLVLKSSDAMIRDLQAKVKAGLKRPLTIESYLHEKWAEADSE